MSDNQVGSGQSSERAGALLACEKSARPELSCWLLALQSALPVGHVLVIARQERLRSWLLEKIQRTVRQCVIHRSRAQRGRRELAGLVAVHKPVKIGSRGTGSSLQVLVESQS